ncbi:hypothetical protein NNC19_16625 [Clostridium sp. SHJSY1]|uniref:hypothetical protein n=1 Tax=Clostridium sp. SHJSY1 TaxID=2942483 RepID=UPI0028762AB7|nr:hypothetical protein [Clostridium sp. SHJSY1]MDS0527317.1 hypothetical protein [Clostridium sp. SHJSY1]
MKGFRSAKYKVFAVVLGSLFLISCKSSNEEKKIDGVKIEKGAIIQNENGTYSNYDLQDGKYQKLESDELVSLYDSASGNYITQKDGKFNSFYLGNIKELKDVSLDDIDLKLSPNGNYLSYFRKEEGILNLKIISLKDGTSVEFNSKVAISDTYMDWIDEDTIAYYGISDDRVNGIFKYNLKEKKEDIFYKLDGGVIQFIKNVSSGVICIQETLDNKKIVKLLDRNGEEKEFLPSTITFVSDIVTDGECYYFIGKVKDNNVSLYKVSKGDVKRKVFDFPVEIDENKGLDMDSEGNVLFIGKSIANSKCEEVYKLSKDGSISKIKDSLDEYGFVKHN